MLVRKMSSFQPIFCSIDSPPGLKDNADIAGVGVRTMLVNGRIDADSISFS